MIFSKGTDINVTSAKILLVGDESDIVSEATALIKDIKCKLITASDPNQIIELFDKIEPDILVLVCMEVAKAEGYYLDLYRNSQKIQTTKHNSLLVCKAKDTEVAYQMCLRKLFDDYVVIRPLLDPFRLTISIRNLLAGQKMLDQSNELHQRVESVCCSMDQLIQESLTEGANISNQLSQSEKELNQHIQKKFQDLARQMTLHTYDGVVKVMDQVALDKQLSQFSEKNLSSDITYTFKKQQVALDQLLKRFKTNHRTQTQVAPGLDIQPNPVKTKILAVDDDPTYLTVLTRMLANEGFEVFSANNATEGLRMANKLRPAVIMLDYEMPEVSGLDFTKKAQASPHLCQIPIIMLTGHAERKLVQQIIAIGVSGYIIKSSPKAVILQKLRSFAGLDKNPMKNPIMVENS